MRRTGLPLDSQSARMLEMTVCAGQECGMSAEECAAQAQGVVAKLPRANAAILYGLMKLFGKRCPRLGAPPGLIPAQGGSTGSRRRT